MRKNQKIKVKYVYLEPKTPEEKADQQRKLDSAYKLVFDKALISLEE